MSQLVFGGLADTRDPAVGEWEKIKEDLVEELSHAPPMPPESLGMWLERRANELLKADRSDPLDPCQLPLRL